MYTESNEFLYEIEFSSVHRVSGACFIVLSLPTFYSLRELLHPCRYPTVDIKYKILAVWILFICVVTLASVKNSRQIGRVNWRMAYKVWPLWLPNDFCYYYLCINKSIILHKNIIPLGIHCIVCKYTQRGYSSSGWLADNMFILNAMPNEVKGNDGWHENSPASIIRNIFIANLYGQQYWGVVRNVSSSHFLHEC